MKLNIPAENFADVESFAKENDITYNIDTASSKDNVIVIKVKMNAAVFAVLELFLDLLKRVLKKKEHVTNGN